MKPLFLISNDDGYQSKGINALIDVARQLGDVVVVAPKSNSSGLSHSLTGSMPLRVVPVSHEEGLSIYRCDGTPVDCVKLGHDFFCPRKPDLILSGINHGSNASINVLYSGTMGAALEGALCGFNAIGFSLLDHSPDADFRQCMPWVGTIIEQVLATPLPDGVALNVNFPTGEIKGLQNCRQARARWLDSYERRVDPRGHPYYWLTGRFECHDNGPGTDQWALEHGFASVVPTSTDFTAKGVESFCV